MKNNTKRDHKNNLQYSLQKCGYIHLACLSIIVYNGRLRLRTTIKRMKKTIGFKRRKYHFFMKPVNGKQFLKSHWSFLKFHLNVHNNGAFFSCMTNPNLLFYMGFYLVSQAFHQVSPKRAWSGCFDSHWFESCSTLFKTQHRIS